MKVAQLTLNGYFNYGNILQKYSLYHTLKKFSDDVEVLWNEGTIFFPETATNFPPQNPFPPNFPPSSHQQYILREAVRDNKIKEFELLNIKTRFDLPYIEEIGDDYDFFVVGSDQVWNPYFTAPEYFLSFAPREKRIAYAASIAAPAIPENKKKFFKQGFSGFDYISVREEKSVEIIKELTGQDALLLLDPTLLLTPQEWLEVAQKPGWLNDEKYKRGYILTYYLRNNPPPLVASVGKYLNLPVINLLDWDNYWHYVTGPEEFIYLFSKASLVFTNSFHGCCFSILFKRPFLNVEIDDGQNMSTRIPGLLKMFGLEDRAMIFGKNYSADFMLNIDYRNRDIVLPLEREKAFNFLAGAFGVLTPFAGGGGHK